MGKELMKVLDCLGQVCNLLDKVDDTISKEASGDECTKALWKAIEEAQEGYAILNDNMKYIDKVEANLQNIFNLGGF